MMVYKFPKNISTSTAKEKKMGIGAAGATEGDMALRIFLGPISCHLVITGMEPATHPRAFLGTGIIIGHPEIGRAS